MIPLSGSASIIDASGTQVVMSVEPTELKHGKPTLGGACWWCCLGGVGGAYLQLQHQVHPLLAQGVDVVQDEGDDDVDAVGLVGGNAVLEKLKPRQIL